MADPTADLDASFEDARRRLDDIVADADRNRERARTLAEQSRTITADVRSPRGEVVVRAGVGGRIDAITFGPGAESLGLDTLARLTVHTIADAQHAAMRRLAEQGAAQFGTDSDIARGLYRDADTGYPPATPTFG